MNIARLRTKAEDLVSNLTTKDECEKRVQEALSNRSWAPHPTLLNEIAEDTFQHDRYGMVMRLLWKAVEAPPRNWRSISKALVLADHLLKHGAERVLGDVLQHVHDIDALTDFTYYDGNHDTGAVVRERARHLADLLTNPDRIRTQRVKAREIKSGYGDYSEDAPSRSYRDLPTGSSSHGDWRESERGHTSSGKYVSEEWAAGYDHSTSPSPNTSRSRAAHSRTSSVSSDKIDFDAGREEYSGRLSIYQEQEKREAALAAAARGRRSSKDSAHSSNRSSSREEGSRSRSNKLEDRSSASGGGASGEPNFLSSDSHRMAATTNRQPDDFSSFAFNPQGSQRGPGGGPLTTNWDGSAGNGQQVSQGGPPQHQHQGQVVPYGYNQAPSQAPSFNQQGANQREQQAWAQAPDPGRGVHPYASSQPGQQMYKQYPNSNAGNVGQQYMQDHQQQQQPQHQYGQPQQQYFQQYQQQPQRGLQQQVPHGGFQQQPPQQGFQKQSSQQGFQQQPPQQGFQKQPSQQGFQQQPPQQGFQQQSPQQGFQQQSPHRGFQQQPPHQGFQQQPPHQGFQQQPPHQGFQQQPPHQGFQQQPPHQGVQQPFNQGQQFQQQRSYAGQQPQYQGQQQMPFQGQPQPPAHGQDFQQYPQHQVPQPSQNESNQQPLVQQQQAPPPDAGSVPSQQADPQPAADGASETQGHQHPSTPDRDWVPTEVVRAGIGGQDLAAAVGGLRHTGFKPSDVGGVFSGQGQRGTGPPGPNPMQRVTNKPPAPPGQTVEYVEEGQEPRAHTREFQTARAKLNKTGLSSRLVETPGKEQQARQPPFPVQQMASVPVAETRPPAPVATHVSGLWQGLAKSSQQSGIGQGQRPAWQSNIGKLKSTGLIRPGDQSTALPSGSNPVGGGQGQMGQEQRAPWQQGVTGLRRTGLSLGSDGGADGTSSNLDMSRLTLNSTSRDQASWQT